jgi:hypothetical protein
VDSVSGEFTGPDITFVYPDFRTGIRGTFYKGVLVHGVEVEITATRCRPGFREIQTKVKLGDFLLAICGMCIFFHCDWKGW